MFILLIRIEEVIYGASAGAMPGSKEEAVGREFLVIGILCGDSERAWERGSDRELCKEPGGRIQETVSE